MVLWFVSLSPLLHLPASEAGPVPHSDIMRPSWPCLGPMTETHNLVSSLFVVWEGKVGSASNCYFKTLQSVLSSKNIKALHYIWPGYRPLSMFQYFQIDQQQHWDISTLSLFYQLQGLDKKLHLIWNRYESKPKTFFCAINCIILISISFIKHPCSFHIFICAVCWSICLQRGRYQQ